MKQIFETLKVDEPVDHVMLITLNRPDSANALNTQMANDLGTLQRDQPCSFKKMNVHADEQRDTAQ